MTVNSCRNHKTYTHNCIFIPWCHILVSTFPQHTPIHHLYHLNFFHQGDVIGTVAAVAAVLASICFTPKVATKRVVDCEIKNLTAQGDEQRSSLQDLTIKDEVESNTRLPTDQNSGKILLCWKQSMLICKYIKLRLCNNRNIFFQSILCASWILIDWTQNICWNYTATYMSPKTCLSNKDMLPCYHHGIIVDTVKVTSQAHWTPDELDAELQKHCSHLWKNLIEIRLHIFPDPVATVDGGWKGWKNLTVGLCQKFKTKRGLTKCSSVNAPLPFPRHITVRFKTSAVIRSPIFVLEQDVSQTWCNEHQQTGWFRYLDMVYTLEWSVERVAVLLRHHAWAVLSWVGGFILRIYPASSCTSFLPWNGESFSTYLYTRWCCGGWDPALSVF